MVELLAPLFQPPLLLQLAALLLLAAGVGALANWLVMCMLFAPHESEGVGPLRWQGLVPAHAERLATLLMDHALGKMTTPYELFLSMEPERLTQHVITSVNADMEDYVEQVFGERYNVIWENLPKMIKSRVYARVRRQLPQILDNIIEDLAENIEELVDLRQLVIRRLTEDSTPLVHLVEASAAREITLAPWVGAAFGLGVGLLVLPLLTVLPFMALAPLLGLLAGAVSVSMTHSIMLKPARPRWIGPFRWQGLMLRRKVEVANRFAAICVSEVINLRALMLEMLTGDRADRTRAIIRRRIKPLVDNSMMRGTIQWALGAEGYSGLRQMLAEKAVALALEPLSDPAFSSSRSPAMEAVVQPRLQAMSDGEFQRMLLLAFRDDAWKLQAVAALLGLSAGAALAVVVGWHSLGAALK